MQGDKKHFVLAHLFDKPCFLGLLAMQVIMIVYFPFFPWFHNFPLESNRAKVLCILPLRKYVLSLIIIIICHNNFVEISEKKQIER